MLITCQQKILNFDYLYQFFNQNKQTECQYNCFNPPENPTSSLSKNNETKFAKKLASRIDCCCDEQNI